MRLMSDPLIHYHLLKFCMNTRLDFLGRNVIPANMHTANEDLRHIGPRHVDVTVRLRMKCSARPPLIHTLITHRMCATGASSSSKHHTIWGVTPSLPMQPLVSLLSTRPQLISCACLPDLLTSMNGCARNRICRRWTRGPAPGSRRGAQLAHD